MCITLSKSAGRNCLTLKVVCTDFPTAKILARKLNTSVVLKSETPVFRNGVFASDKNIDKNKEKWTVILVVSLLFYQTRFPKFMATR